MDEPLVTLALPLYKSRRFLDIIVANLEAIECPNLEILISDRHCADDALDVLRARFGNDGRFQFLQAHDEINWVEHFNFLLRTATGKYFFWMMHDDTYPPDYVSRLVEPLELDPEAVLAYGGIELLSSDGSRELREPVPQVARTGNWTMHEIMRRFLDGRLLLAVRGLYRREQVTRRGNFILPTRDLIAADFLWTFATAFEGRWIFVPNVRVKKRIHAGSALGHWKSHSAQNTFAEMRVLFAYLVPSAPNWNARVRGLTAIFLWMILRLGGDFLHWTGLHKRFHKPLQQRLDARLRP